MRSAVLLAALALGALQAAPALASCAAPEPVAQRAARADAVVYGRATAFTDRSRRQVSVDVERVLKGLVPAQIVVGIGPDAGGGAGATSVDYAIEPGSVHTLYLRREGPAAFRTDACSGSHPGGPVADEVAAFGSGSPPEPAPAGRQDPEERDRALALAALVLVLAASFLAFRRVAARRG